MSRLLRSTAFSRLPALAVSDDIIATDSNNRFALFIVFKINWFILKNICSVHKIGQRARCSALAVVQMLELLAGFFPLLHCLLKFGVELGVALVYSGITGIAACQ